MKQAPEVLIAAYKLQCPPWVLDLWDEDDDAYIERHAAPNREEDDDLDS